MDHPTEAHRTDQPLGIFVLSIVVGEIWLELINYVVFKRLNADSGHGIQNPLLKLDGEIFDDNVSLKESGLEGISEENMEGDFFEHKGHFKRQIEQILQSLQLERGTSHLARFDEAYEVERDNLETFKGFEVLSAGSFLDFRLLGNAQQEFFGVQDVGVHLLKIFGLDHLGEVFGEKLQGGDHQLYIVFGAGVLLVEVQDLCEIGLVDGKFLAVDCLVLDLFLASGR